MLDTVVECLWNNSTGAEVFATFSWFNPVVAQVNSKKNYSLSSTGRTSNKKPNPDGRRGAVAVVPASFVSCGVKSYQLWCRQRAAVLVVFFPFKSRHWAKKNSLRLSAFSAWATNVRNDEERSPKVLRVWGLWEGHLDNVAETHTPYREEEDPFQNNKSQS